MDKLLTISIAAYNVEYYLENCLDSIIDSKVKDYLEVFVVDDGGSDSSYEIAKKYEKKYPDIVHAIHKDNGGYGSVQNYSMKNATGKYFKILDGDDWFSIPGLEELVKFLQKSRADVVVTNYFKGNGINDLVNMEVGRSCPKEVLLDPNEIKEQFGMWALTYSTELLKKAQLELPLHTLYTDRIYSTIPFGFAQSVFVLDCSVYCYRTGRDGQSISRDSRIKRANEFLDTTRELLQYYITKRVINKGYLLEKISMAYLYSIRVLLLLPITGENQKKLVSYEKEAQIISPEIFSKAGCMKTKTSLILKMIRKSKYGGYWALKVIPKSMFDF